MIVLTSTVLSLTKKVTVRLREHSCKNAILPGKSSYFRYIFTFLPSKKCEFALTKKTRTLESSQQKVQVSKEKIDYKWVSNLCDEKKKKSENPGKQTEISGGKSPTVVLHMPE